MTNERIRKIIAEETTRLPENVEFRVTFHRNSAYIYARELEEYERAEERWVDGVYSPCVDKYISVYPIFPVGRSVYGVQGEQRVRNVVREMVDDAINSVPAPTVHKVPTADAVERVKKEFPGNVFDRTGKSSPKEKVRFSKIHIND